MTTSHNSATKKVRGEAAYAVGTVVYWGDGSQVPVKITKRWDDYPTTYRYLLDNNVVADHSECWPVEGHTDA